MHPIKSLLLPLMSLLLTGGTLFAVTEPVRSRLEIILLDGTVIVEQACPGHFSITFGGEIKRQVNDDTWVPAGIEYFNANVATNSDVNTLTSIEFNGFPDGYLPVRAGGYQLLLTGPEWL